MASERDEALQAVVPEPANQPPALETAIADASTEAERTKRQELSQQHELKVKKAELGWFGIIFGSENHAPIVIAFLVAAFGVVGAGLLWFLAFHTGQREFWSGEAHIALGAVTTALGYVFGRGSKTDSK